MGLWDERSREVYGRAGCESRLGLVEPFSRNYPIITWHLRGHAQTDSPVAAFHYSVEIMVDDLYRLLGHLKVDKAVVGGLSFGGYLSLHFYHHHPQMVRALILIDTGPGYRTPERAAQWNRDCLARAEILEKGGAHLEPGVTWP